MPNLNDNSKNAILVIGPGYKSRKKNFFTNQDIDEADALRTALHEIGHALEYNILDASKPTNDIQRYFNLPGRSTFKGDAGISQELTNLQQMNLWKVT